MATTKSPRLFSSFIGASCRQRLLLAATQRSSPFSTTPYRPASNSNDGPFGGLNLSAILEAPQGSSLLTSELESNLNASHLDQPHKLHIYATKHNTHITFVQPARPASQTASSGISGTSASAADQKKQIDVLMSLSTGNIGFRKAGRGSYDAAYQLAAFVLKQIQEKGMLRDVRSLDVILRGYGAGREAVSKALLGSEGRFIRNRITSVVDATRLKQGGPRSKKPRRLG